MVSRKRLNREINRTLEQQELANVCFGTIVESSSATVVVAAATFEDFFSGFVCMDLHAIACSNMRLREHLEFNEPV